ncbi:exocyst complex component EXO84B [Tanacetum coccineum]
MLIRALPGSMEEEANYEGSGNKLVRMAETEAQQMALLANASLLADELLPRAAMKLTPVAQSIYKGWHLVRNMIHKYGWNMEEIEWFPLLQYFRSTNAYILIIDVQELYAKLYRMSGIASEMFVGREQGPNFFGMDIEEGPQPLGPLGLQQFADICQEAMDRLSGKPRFVNGERDLSSPTASVSAQSIIIDQISWKFFADICQEAMDRLSGKPTRSKQPNCICFSTINYHRSDLMEVRKAIDSACVYLESATFLL